eukprot:scpid107072/ scgid12457/ 
MHGHHKPDHFGDSTTGLATIAQHAITHEHFGLSSVPFDVWCDSLLALLPIADIFQLCGVNSHFRKLLHNEYTFRRLCKHRYQISPYLKMSYIQISKVIYIANRVASVHYSQKRDFINCVFGNYDRRVFQCKMRLTVQLSSLVLRLPENVNTPTSW